PPQMLNLATGFVMPWWNRPLAWPETRPCQHTFMVATAPVRVNRIGTVGCQSFQQGPEKCGGRAGTRRIEPGAKLQTNQQNAVRTREDGHGDGHSHAHDHGFGHSHSHGHEGHVHPPLKPSVLGWAMAATLGLVVAEIFGGIFGRSIAL